MIQKRVRTRFYKFFLVSKFPSIRQREGLKKSREVSEMKFLRLIWSNPLGKVPPVDQFWDDSSNKTHRVWRRYTNFLQLRQYLEVEHPSCIIPPMPAKRTGDIWNQLTQGRLFTIERSIKN